jgi:hypothetical protein
MPKSSQNTTEENKNVRMKQRQFARVLWIRLVELWMFFTIALFFVMRVLGSRALQHILGRTRGHHLP